MFLKNELEWQKIIGSLLPKHILNIDIVVEHLRYISSTALRPNACSGCTYYALITAIPGSSLGEIREWE